MPIVVLCLAVYFQGAQSYSNLNADIKVTFYLFMVFVGICGKCIIFFFFLLFSCASVTL